MKRILACAIVLAIPSAASAAEAPASESRPSRTFTITTDILRPLYGVAALSGEVSAGERFGIGAWMGAGAVRRDSVLGHVPIFGKCAGSFCERNTLVTGGIAASFYAIGGFSAPQSLQLGAEMSIAHEWGLSIPSDYTVTVARELFGGYLVSEPSNRTIFTPGVLAGYKLVSRAGFTVNLVGVIGYRIGDDPNPFASRATANVGWTF
jgi:hypothetical protein